MNNAERNRAATLLQKHIRGYLTRKQVSVKTEAPGIVSTTIRPPSEGRSSVANFMTPLSGIQQNMQRGATYHRLTVHKGALNGSVLGTGVGKTPKSPVTLAESASENSAVINGGYFVHKQGLETDTGESINGIGRPVGPTSTRKDHTPVPSPWGQDYGQLEVGNEVGLSSGPLLTYKGRLPEIPNHDRFKYRLANGHDNPLNKRAGALTHASDHNERAALSIDLDSDSVRMHTLTAQGKRNLGATMKEWQQITAFGAGPLRKVKDTTYVARSSTLNLDGGGSVFMGIKRNNTVRQISRGGDTSGLIRPVANIISAKKGE